MIRDRNAQRKEQEEKDKETVRKMNEERELWKTGVKREYSELKAQYL